MTPVSTGTPLVVPSGTYPRNILRSGPMTKNRFDIEIGVIDKDY
jgi:dUTPase